MARCTAQFGSIAAVLAAAQFALVLALKLSRGLEHEVLWVSHAALGLGAAGLLIRSVPLIGTAFVAVAGLHALWLVDAAVGLTTGLFPLGLTRYLLDADAWTLVGTSHHLWLVPLLGAAIWASDDRKQGRWRGWLAAAVVLCTTLGIISRFTGPPGANVNFAHAVLPGSTHPLVLWHASLPTAGYLAVHTAFVALVCLLPGALVARRLSHGRTARPSPAAAVITPDQEFMPMSSHTSRSRAAAFTLIELIAVIVVLGMLAGVAVPKYYDYTSAAKESADEASIAGINTALNQAYLNHRMNDAGSSSWITALSQLADVMDTGALPHGITIDGSNLVDQRGNTYALTAETATSPARVILVVSGGGS